jgi:hypothetical protein
MNKILFNKTADGITEIKKHIGGLSNINFNYLEPDLTRAIRFVTDVIGDEVYQVAQTHYLSNEYGTETSDELKVKNELVYLIQEATVWKGLHAYAVEGSVIFDGSGIHIQKANEKQAQAFEWQIDKLMNKYLVSAYSAIEDLIQFLNKNKATITQWADSDYEKQAKLLFIRSASEFDVCLYIDGSQRLYMALQPHMRRIQNNEIRNVVKSRFDKLLNETELTETEKQMRILCCDAQAFLSMAKAVMQFPLEIMPNSVVQRFTSFFTTMGASKEARTDLIQAALKFYTDEGNRCLAELSALIFNTDKPTDTPAFKPRRSRSRNAIGF